ncbi:Thiamin-phosphate pyrophosphorylase [hydrothermal vent metagenome]|uniref:Thiamin-phosphate pyrophosphorylase n=1 Tax=hydrothermal vent metagenome TaxID=652676 RepID=A0A1W1BL28_9ZZZZ
MTNSNLSQAHYDGLERLIDANLNRLGEGIRVIEDINRYIHNNKSLTHRLKSLRHKLQEAYSIDRLSYRDIQNDIQKESIDSELIRASLNDLIVANFSRSQESSRVLEESFKLIDIKLSETFKSIRYELYEIESIYFEDITNK